MRPALLFDLDGTLVHTDHLHYEAFRELLGGLGRRFDQAEFKTRVMGRPNTLIFAEYFPDRSAADQRALSEAKEARVREWIADGGRLEPTRGLHALLDWADATSIGCAIVTNAPPANAATMLAAAGLAERLTIVVSGEALPHGKPHPLPYLEGLRLTAGDPGRSIAFEDSIPGLKSAVAAGIACIGMGTGHTADELVAAGANRYARDFEDAALLACIARRTGVGVSR